MSINSIPSHNLTPEHKCKCVHELFLLNAINNPESVALNCDGNLITYAELNRAADDAAASLVDLGVIPGCYVPILLPKSKELVISLLAVLKTGAAYSLLDMNWPEHRLCEIIEILDPPLLITKEALTSCSSLASWSPSQKRATDVNKFNPVEVNVDSPCCVFFTSGTSGKPKGVLSPHRGTSRLFGRDSFANFGPNTVIALAAAVAWDAFSLELWGALLNGGTSWISNEPYLSAEALRKGILQYGVNTIWITSSLFNMIIDEDINAFTGLQQIISGGERLSVSHVEKFLIKYPMITLINGYGPVESTIFATTHRITLDDCRRTDGIPIGSPVSGTQIYILNDKRCCVEGEAGEIYIAGDGLAIKYICDPYLTAEKFTLIELNGVLTLTYRTGDLGVWDNGLLHFKGRIDRQIKLRGHRVELSEVERQIENILPNIRACRVILKKDVIDYKLVAFCIPVNKMDTLESANKILQSKLVSYQCPSAIIPIETFPLTQNGKMDEHKLLENIFFSPIKLPPQPDLSQERDILRYKVINVFSEVLHLPVVPSNIPILELGGTSLTIGRICARLTKQLGYVVPISWLYRFPTIDELLSHIRATNPTINVFAKITDLSQPELNSMQLSYLMKYIVNPTDRTSHCLMTWIIKGDLDQKSLKSAISYVHQRHEALHAKYVYEPKTMIQLCDICPPKLNELQAQYSVQEAISALRDELSGELDPINGCIWRTAIVPLKLEKVWIFGCAVHHIAFDGWSESVLAADIAIGYNAAIRIEKPSSQAAPSLANAYAARISLLAQASSSDNDHLLSAELYGMPELTWPVYENNYSDPDTTCNEICISLDRDLVAKIDTLAIDTHSSRFEILLASWAQTISEVTGQKDFGIGTPVRQRYTTELELSVGCFINMICLRMRGDALASGKKGIVGTSNIVQRSFSTQDVSLDRVLELARPVRSTRPPLFQTLFALQDNPPPKLYLYGVDCEFLRQPYLELPLELHAEIWPSYNDGDLRLVISYRADKVSTIIIKQLTKKFTERLYKISAGE